MRSISLMRVLAGLLLSAILAACGGGGGGASTPPVATTPAPSPLAYPIPSGLWTAPASAVPASGNYVYLQSDAGDYVGAGKTYRYTSADSLIKLNVNNNGLGLYTTVQGNENWTGSFLLPSGAGNLQAGYFAGLARTTSANAAVGGLDWSGNGRGCNVMSGWVVIDKVTLTAGAVTALDLRFEQHCEAGLTSLHGQIHWTQANADSAQAPRPAPIPSTLWQPSQAMPTTGNYLYLQSGQGDPAGGGSTSLYTSSNAIFTLNASGAHLGVQVAGDQNVSGDFQGMQGMSQLTTGYYAGLARYPFNNPVLGGMSWGGSCNTLSGWFAVDKISYNGTALAAIDLRFEQYCDGSTVPMRGQLHWVAGETGTAPGPVNPPPAGLWTPGASFTPPPGSNYVYLASDPGDYIGGGKTQLFVPGNAAITVVTNLTAGFRINVGDAGGWTGNFFGMNTLSQLQPGYYGDLQRYPFNNKLKGGLDWSGYGAGCNTLSGWFVVDKVTYSMAELTAIDLRFEQHCEGAAPALHGQIHWVKP
jgi:hypothetical protein